MIPASVTASDEIGHSATLLRERLAPTGLEERLSELLHLHQSHTHHGRLRVITPPKPVDETRGESDNVLEGSTQGHARDIVHHTDVEVGSVEKVLHDAVVDGRELFGERRQVSGGIVRNRCLRKLLRRNLVRNVCTRKCAAVYSEPFTNVIAKERDPLGGDIDTLDAGHRAGIGEDRALDLLADVADELVRDVEDEDCRLSYRFLDVWGCDDIVGEVDRG